MPEGDWLWRASRGRSAPRQRPSAPPPRRTSAPRSALDDDNADGDRSLEVGAGRSACPRADARHGFGCRHNGGYSRPPYPRPRHCAADRPWPVGSRLTVAATAPRGPGSTSVRSPSAARSSRSSEADSAPGTSSGPARMASDRNGGSHVPASRHPARLPAVVPPSGTALR